MGFFSRTRSLVTGRSFEACRAGIALAVVVQSSVERVT